MGKLKGAQTGVTETNTTQGARSGQTKVSTIAGPAYGGSNKAAGGGKKPTM
jgi:hypothetical protein